MPWCVGMTWQFLKYNRKRQFLPILIVLLPFSVPVFLADTGAAPFIYTIF